jgi:hypothetical protein
MATCPTCGSRRLRRVHHPLTPVVKTVSGRHRFRCSKCQWSGWLSREDFQKAEDGSGGRDASGRRDSSRQHRSPTKPNLDLGLDQLLAETKGEAAVAATTPIEPDDIPVPADASPAAPSDSSINTFRRTRHFGSRHHHNKRRTIRAGRKRKKATREVLLAAALALGLLALVWLGGKACATMAPPPEVRAVQSESVNAD